MKIKFNEDGNFLGVYDKDKEGNDIIVSPDAWNDKIKKTWEKE